MTIKEWRLKGPDARREYEAELQAGTTTLDWDAWRVTKGYVVDHVASGG
jgi:hypothetical protein